MAAPVFTSDQNVEVDDTTALLREARPLTPIDDSLAPGSRIGCYELIRLLGRGGMGEVHLARDTRLGRRVAIKFVFSPTPEFADRFDREARATARCHHENIVVIHEVGKHGRLLFMVLEYLLGETLRDLLDSGPLPYTRAFDIVRAVVGALTHAHAAGLVHRDLKPDNVMLTDSGTVKVLDFGVAKAWQEPTAEHPAVELPEPIDRRASDSDGPLTQEGMLIGTVPYMAPEQVRGERVDARVDIWALGVMFFQMVVGRHPLDRSDGLERFKSQVADRNRPMPSVASAAPDLPKPIAALIQRCLAKEPSERFQSATELGAALERALAPTRSRSLGEGECPYPGLAYFAETDLDLFFGRSADITRALKAMDTRPLTILIGSSGSGKSSFVRAGLIPALRRVQPWDTHIARPGRKPLATLAELCSKLGGQRFGIDVLHAQPGAFGSALRARAARSGQSQLLVVDPFEELYLQGAIDDAQRTAFLRCLIAAADDASSPVRVLLCMRADFVHRMSEDIELLGAIGGSMLFLAPLSRNDMVAALERPAELVGYHFEEGLAESMAISLSSTAAALPLLQFAATALWRDRDRKRRLLTEAAYERLGGVEGALSDHADRVIAGLAPPAREVARRLMLKLVTPDRTRAIVERAELVFAGGDRKAVANLIDELTKARLLVVDSDSDAPTVELVHDSLIFSWPLLSRWIEAEQEWLQFYDELRSAARAWGERGRPRSSLWRGDAARQVYRWYQRINAGDVSPREKEFADEVVALDQRALVVRRRLLVAGVTLVALIAVGVAIALVVINRAEHAARAKAEEARDAAHRALAAQRKRAEAEARADSATAEVKRRRHDLRRANRELKRLLGEQKAALARARAAREIAEAESARARRAESSVTRQKTVLVEQKATLQKQKAVLERQKAELQHQKSALQKLLAERAARVKELQRRLRGISTDLK